MSRTLDHQQRQQQKQQQKPTVSTTRGQSRRNEGGRKRWSWAETPWEMKHHRLPINENGWENESRPPPMPNAQVEEDMYEAPVDGRREERPVQLDEERQHPAYAIPPSDDVQLVSGGGSQLNQPPQQQRATMWPGTQQQQTQQPLPSTQSPIESTDTTDSKDGKTGAVKPDSKKNTGYNPQYRTYHPDSALLSPHSPGQVRHPIRRPTEDERHWHHGLYDCASDPAVCFTGLFCPCVLYGKTQYRLTQKADKKDATNMLGYKTVNGSCVVMGVFWPLGCKHSLFRPSFRCEIGSTIFLRDMIAVRVEIERKNKLTK